MQLCYFLTRLQNLVVVEQVTESLSGRAAMLRVLTVSRREDSSSSSDPVPWESKKLRGSSKTTSPGLTGHTLWNTFLRGGYPELIAEPLRDFPLWHSSYIQTYLEREGPSLRQVGDLLTFRGFLRTIAARSGQLLKINDVARDLGVAVNTAKAWLSVLEAAFRVIVLRTYRVNVGKRLVKTPKVYFDTGTLCHLAGLKNAHHAAGPMGGAIFETAVLLEIVKGICQSGRGAADLLLANLGGHGGRSDCRDRWQADPDRSQNGVDPATSHGGRHSGLPAGPR